MEKSEIVESLQSQIERLQATVDMWEEAGIPRRTIVVLLWHYTKVSQRVIGQVLDGIDNLYDEYFSEDEDG